MRGNKTLKEYLIFQSAKTGNVEDFYTQLTNVKKDRKYKNLDTCEIISRNSKKIGMNAFHCAIVNGHINLVEELIDKFEFPI